MGRKWGWGSEAAVGATLMLGKMWFLRIMNGGSYMHTRKFTIYVPFKTALIKNKKNLFASTFLCTIWSFPVSSQQRPVLLANYFVPPSEIMLCHIRIKISV